MELHEAVEVLNDYLNEYKDSKNTIEIAIEVVLEELENITLAVMKDLIGNWARK